VYYVVFILDLIDSIGFFITMTGSGMAAGEHLYKVRLIRLVLCLPAFRDNSFHMNLHQDAQMDVASTVHNALPASISSLPVMT